MAGKYDLIIVRKVHAEYGSSIHEAVAGEGFPIDDFFFPGLVIDALDRGTNEALLRCVREKQAKGCGPSICSAATMERIISRGGRVKNLFGRDGKQGTLPSSGSESARAHPFK